MIGKVFFYLRTV